MAQGIGNVKGVVDRSVVEFDVDAAAAALSCRSCAAAIVVAVAAHYADAVPAHVAVVQVSRR